jgi:predicted nucleic acid-binding Zn ribbon protein
MGAMLKLSAALSGWGPAEKSLAREPLVLLEAGWDDIVGSQVAKNSHPTRIADGALLITTRSSAWSHQLMLLGEHVLRAVAARVPTAGVSQLRFRVGRLPLRAPEAHRCGSAPRWTARRLLRPNRRWHASATP